MPAETIPVPAEAADVVEFDPKDFRKGDGRADVGEARRQGADRRVVYAAGEIPDDLLAAILAAEPPPETAQYDWEPTADDSPDAAC